MIHIRHKYQRSLSAVRNVCAICLKLLFNAIILNSPAVKINAEEISTFNFS